VNAPERVPVPASAVRPLDAAPPETALIDGLGRRVSYLRLSVTDRCDFRCTYCMSEKMTFLPRSEVMSLEESLQIVKTFVRLGVSKVRVTGGEPLVRHDVLWLLERIAALPGLRELVMTTNGSQLVKYAEPLRAAGVRRLNISLDTLNPDRFHAITRTGRLDNVLAGIEAAREAGFERIRLNALLLRDGNADELADLVQYAVDRGIDLAFIEEMPLGSVARDTHPLTADEARRLMAKRFPLHPVNESTGGPAEYWRIDGSASPSRIGFITPHSHNFCASCNRVRVTAKGDLYPCLGNDGMVPLLPLLREQGGDEAGLRQAIAGCLMRKPDGHRFTEQMAAPKVMRYMSVTGG
jgi:cyclic pyranopterin phosphate synthase